eukprot:52526-Prorocentrum_lima.AAC.1
MDAQQSPGGLSDVPTVPQGIRSVWYYGSCGPDGCQMMPRMAQPQHPPPQHPPPLIEEVLTDNQQQELWVQYPAQMTAPVMQP